MTIEKDGLGDDGVFRWHRKGEFKEGVRMQCLPAAKSNIYERLPPMMKVWKWQSVIREGKEQLEFAPVVGGDGSSTQEETGTFTINLDKP